MGLGENWLNHFSLVLLGWCGFSLNSTYTFSLDYYTTRSCFSSPKFPPRPSTCKECHIFQYTRSASLTTTGFLRGKHCFTPLWHLLPVSAFHISLSSQDFSVGTSESPYCPGLSMEQGWEDDGGVHWSHHRQTYTSDSFCNSSTIPPSSGKESPCWFTNLGTKCLSQTWWVNRPTPQ